MDSNTYLNDPARNRKNNLAVIILSVLLVIVVVLYFMQRNEHSVLVKQMNTDKDSLQTELTNMVSGYDSLKTNNDTINRNLQTAQTRVVGLLNEIQHVKSASYAQLSRYRSEVNTLRKIMRNYVVQIDSLNRRNQILMAENKQVKTENVSIRSQKEQVESQKSELEKKVAQASVLDANNLVAEAINSHNKVVNRVRKAEKFRVNLNLSKNVTAHRGPKDIYVRITRPDQKLLVKSPGNLFKFEGSKIPYSAVRQVEYEGNELSVSIFFDPAQSELIPGVYTVDVFADGSNIGTARFELK
ncbi:MAG: hypothetical protein Q8862_10080 [Bacteroidota bacterium]|nr:hypothetical protein [Bacteroidota bacterium]MDP4205980.1 hypothetical protein [Bacteroidota bacterium]